MAKKLPEYCVPVRMHDSTSDSFLDMSQEEMQWKKVSDNSHVITMDSLFLKSLKVNPPEFIDSERVPIEWSHVNLVAFYNGEDILSVNNCTPFAVVHTTVRAQCSNGIAHLQSRASKIRPVCGDKQQPGILLAPIHVVLFKQLKQCVTLRTFLTMQDKVKIFEMTTFTCNTPQ
jgi:hypothetical protein